MSETVRLGLPLIAAAQAQKHVTHNEAMVALDALACLSIADRDLAAPPAVAAEGAAYIVAAPASGDWEGEEGRIAFRLDGGWRFHDPVAGLTAHIADEGVLSVHDGSGWIGVGSGASELQNLSLIGLGTMADAANPFSAVVNKALWAARRVADGGDGNLRYTMSKEAAGNVLSMLFQTDFSARAEFGLIGDDDLIFKVSPDGASWTEAMRLEAATGRARFPAGIAGMREVLAGPRTYHVDATGGDDGNDGLTAGTAFATIQKAWDVLVMLDLAGNDVTIQLAEGTYSAGLEADVSPVGGNVVVSGNASAPENVLVPDIDIDCVAKVTVRNFKSDGATHGLRANVAGAYVIVGEGMMFGSASQAHMTAANNGYIEIRAGYEIVDGASAHLNTGTGGIIRHDAASTVTLTGTPDFSSAFARVGQGSGFRASGFNVTYSGAATGKRYDISLNSFIQTFGAGQDFLPGDAAGTTSTGGQYS